MKNEKKKKDDWARGLQELNQKTGREWAEMGGLAGPLHQVYKGGMWLYCISFLVLILNLWLPSFISLALAVTGLFWWWVAIQSWFLPFRKMGFTLDHLEELSDWVWEMQPYHELNKFIESEIESGKTQVVDIFRAEWGNGLTWKKWRSWRARFNIPEYTWQKNSEDRPWLKTLSLLGLEESQVDRLLSAEKAGGLSMEAKQEGPSCVALKETGKGYENYKK